MAGYFTESNYENAVLQLLNEELGYNYIYGPDVERDYHSPLYEDALLPSLQRINKSLPMDALTEAIYKLKNFETGTLLQKNMVFMDYLQNGVPVKYYDKGEERSTLVYLVDFKNPASNEFTVTNQWTFIENSEKRPDVILFVNGLPLVIVELKSPSREETDASAAYRQLRNYMYEIPSMFIYNAVCVMSDLTTSKAGTITSGEDRFMEWKTTDGSYENTQHASFDTFFVGLFEKTRFLDIVKNFICFNVDGQNTFKILAGYHQYFAVKKAIESTKHATVTDGKGGVFWHTQGSGKSLSMVFYAHYLQEALESPTIVVITDRNDLDDQLYGQFARCKDFWFAAARDNGHTYAEFFMKRMERGEQEPPSVMLSATRLLYHMGNIFRDNAPAPAANGVQIDRKRLAQLRQKRIALGHKPDDHELEQQQGFSMKFHM